MNLYFACQGASTDQIITTLFAAAFYALFIYVLTPSRAPDVFYLRSFRRDGTTPRLRKVLQRALGRGLRVSGIRDPRRRSYRPLRYLNVAAFTLKYGTTRYLNLEAGSDWKARLWRSLCTARGAVIDVSDVTDFVLEEVWLGYRTLGPERVLFVGDDTRSVAQWREFLAGVLELPSGAQLRVAVWGATPRSRAAFEHDARTFGTELPAGPRGLHPCGSELLTEPPAARRALEWGELWGGVVAGAFAWAFISTLLTDALTTSGALVAWAAGAALGAYYLLFVFHLLRYFVDAPFARERWVVGGFAFGIAMIPVLIVATDLVRDTATKMRGENNLKALGLALLNYESDHATFPPATGLPPAWGAQPVSWRVAVVPYLHEFGPDDAARITVVARGYRKNEPWDSPHNSQFLKLMPAAYRHPVAGATVPEGYTHYRVVVSPKNTKGPRAPFLSGEPGPRFPAFSAKGSGRVALVAEAAEAVPWTKPDELEYAPGGPLPKLGGHFRHWFKNDVFLVAHADGSVARYPQDLPEERLRDLIAIDP